MQFGEWVGLAYLERVVFLKHALRRHRIRSVQILLPQAQEVHEFRDQLVLGFLVQLHNILILQL